MRTLYERNGMNPINKVVISTKRFVDVHKVAIAVTVTAVVCQTVNNMALRGHDNFLREKGLYDEFYTHRNPK